MKYPSDVSREQFEMIRAIFEGAKKRTKARKIDLYDVFCGILYSLKSGCQWRMLPVEFPKWSTVYYYFRMWKGTNKNEESLFDKV
ncbi:MAG: transposase [Proteobacteria bacterium]|nr:transposase [Pseudomonadota bacterium]